jgi:hypothetical protein
MYVKNILGFVSPSIIFQDLVKNNYDNIFDSFCVQIANINVELLHMKKSFQIGVYGLWFWKIICVEKYLMLRDKKRRKYSSKVIKMTDNQRGKIKEIFYLYSRREM